MSKRDCRCHVELYEHEKNWSWRMDVSYPGVGIKGDKHTYKSKSLAKRQARRVAKQFGIRIDSFGLRGWRIDT